MGEAVTEPRRSAANMGNAMYICQICKKAPATIHLTDIHNNVKKEIHICEGCAAEKGFNLQGAANLPQLLGLAAKKHTAVKQAKARPEDDPACPSCGLRWSQFNERGRLGCPNDYAAFDAKIRAMLTHQVSPPPRRDEPFHVGKSPGPRRAEDEIAIALRDLERKLRQAVAEERYKAAAGLKAEIDELRKKRS